MRSRPERIRDTAEGLHGWEDRPRKGTGSPGEAEQTPLLGDPERSVPWDQARGLCSARVRGWHQLQLGSQLGLEEGLSQERSQDWEGSCGWIST